MYAGDPNSSACAGLSTEAKHTRDENDDGEEDDREHLARNSSMFEKITKADKCKTSQADNTMTRNWIKV